MVVDIKQDYKTSKRITEYYLKYHQIKKLLRISENERYLIIFVVLKLRLIKGKCILFVNSVDKSYKLKLFLGQFGIDSKILNSELPLEHRYIIKLI